MSWSHFNAYLTYYFRANLPGVALTGQVSLSGTALSGVGAMFMSELSPGDWVRLDSHAFQVDSVINDDSAILRSSGIVGPTTATVLTIETHDGTLRADQGDVWLLVKTPDLKEEYCRLRETRTQVIISANSNFCARNLADIVKDTLKEGTFEMPPPPGFNESLHIAWARSDGEHDLGENTPGSHKISLNFIIKGD